MGRRPGRDPAGAAAAAGAGAAPAAGRTAGAGRGGGGGRRGAHTVGALDVPFAPTGR
ncbi:hypothetical protein [Paenibacillus mucilaginosus]|uniref:hypothetical protein n=1 Tax=Paenibacillus mucilaginosus TaxID=61624 RepID=UPI00240E65C4|nr:hypothetical protein [Paenibacillus mucilaginosus]